MDIEQNTINTDPASFIEEANHMKLRHASKHWSCFAINDRITGIKK